MRLPMPWRRSVPAPVDLRDYRMGQPQRAGALTVVPVFGPERHGIAPPRTGVKVKQVAGYGKLELTNPGSEGVAIVPLHVGYIQDRAQNHAMATAAFLGPGQTRRFTDAYCVQESQGGYLTEQQQWFFVLPLELRPAALDSAGGDAFEALWADIRRLNQTYGLSGRGHLEQVLTRHRAVLTQYNSRLELCAGQVGALFFLAERLVGIEIAPDPRYFAEVWMALACFCYGPAAWHREQGFGARKPAGSGQGTEPEPLAAGSLAELRDALAGERSARAEEVGEWLAAAPLASGRLEERDRYLDLRLSTLVDGEYGGQVVTAADRLAYASVFARSV